MNLIKKGSRGEDVKVLQQKLGLSADGIFGSLTEDAVKKFQKDHGLTSDGIVGDKTWAVLLGSGKKFKYISSDPNPRKITEIILHCEATPKGEEFSEAQVEVGHKARKFSPYVRNGKTWHIGYHYIIHLDGTVVACRPESIIGCHCSGHNSHSIGVSYVGGCAPRTDKQWMNHPMDTRTPEQKEAFINILKELKEKYPNAKIYPHYKFSAKACPCFDVEAEYKNL